MANYGYCITSISAVRSEPSERSEMVTQLFFGELFTVLEDTVKWLYIRNEIDGYTGWIDRKQYAPMNEQAYAVARGSTIAFPEDIVLELTNEKSGEMLRVSYGTPLHINLQGKVEINGQKWIPNGPFFYAPKTLKTENLIAVAKKFLYSPYLWGGRSIFGCDCSGLVQIIFNINGVAIKRDASQQAREGETIHLMDEAQPGDLVFFDNNEREIIHVGMLLDRNSIIHASGYVKIDKIDHYGIFNVALQTYTHKLRIIKRYI